MSREVGDGFDFAYEEFCALVLGDIALAAETRGDFAAMLAAAEQSEFTVDESDEDSMELRVNHDACDVGGDAVAWIDEDDGEVELTGNVQPGADWRQIRHFLDEILAAGGGEVRWTKPDEPTRPLVRGAWDAGPDKPAK